MTKIIMLVYVIIIDSSYYYTSWYVEWVLRVDE